MIAIITYDAAHRKTQDILMKLILNGYNKIHLVVIPWVERKSFKPLYVHRPSHKVELTIEELSQRVNCKYDRVNLSELASYFDKNAFNHIIIGGAGILPEDLALKHNVINAHPGYLPNMKGLDSFKWAILKDEVIGVTTHYISDKADEGKLIQKQIVPVYFEDSFFSLAMRIYDFEIDMLVNAIQLIDNGIATLESLSDDRYKATMRMPHHFEVVMIEKFEQLRKKSPSRRGVFA